MHSKPQIITDADRLRISEDVNRRQRDDLTRAKADIKRLHQENDTAEKIREVIFGLAAATPEPPAWLAGKGIRHGERGGPVLICSDVHYGERIFKDQTGGMNEYNADIARARLKRLFTTTIDLCQNHMGRAGVAYPGIVLCLGGDLIGGDIHEELMITNDRTPQQSVEEMTDLLIAGIKMLTKFFGRVFVVTIVGNHGRTTKKLPMKNRVFTNYDWSIACNLERYFSGYTDPLTGQRVEGHDPKNVKFMTPSQTDAHFTVFGTRFLLTHGDSLGVKGGDGIIGALGPIARGIVKVGDSERQMGRDFDVLLLGHYHQLFWLPNAVVNGCVKGYDEYARNGLRAKYSRPTQALFFVHPEYGMTAQWPVYLEPKPVVAADKIWVGWEK